MTEPTAPADAETDAPSMPSRKVVNTKRLLRTAWRVLSVATTTATLALALILVAAHQSAEWRQRVHVWTIKAGIGPPPYVYDDSWIGPAIATESAMVSAENDTSDLEGRLSILESSVDDAQTAADEANTEIDDLCFALGNWSNAATQDVLENIVRDGCP